MLPQHIAAHVRAPHHKDGWHIVGQLFSLHSLAYVNDNEAEQVARALVSAMRGEVSGLLADFPSIDELAEHHGPQQLDQFAAWVDPKAAEKVRKAHDKARQEAADARAEVETLESVTLPTIGG